MPAQVPQRRAAVGVALHVRRVAREQRVVGFCRRAQLAELLACHAQLEASIRSGGRKGHRGLKALGRACGIAAHAVRHGEQPVRLRVGGREQQRRLERLARRLQLPLSALRVAKQEVGAVPRRLQLYGTRKGLRCALGLAEGVVGAAELNGMLGTARRERGGLVQAMQPAGSVSSGTEARRLARCPLCGGGVAARHRGALASPT